VETLAHIFRDYKKALNSGGTLVVIGGSVATLVGGVFAVAPAALAGVTMVAIGAEVIVYEAGALEYMEDYLSDAVALARSEGRDTIEVTVRWTSQGEWWSFAGYVLEAEGMKTGNWTHRGPAAEIMVATIRDPNHMANLLNILRLSHVEFEYERRCNPR
jgi:hypothetical protein